MAKDKSTDVAVNSYAGMEVDETSAPKMIPAETGDYKVTLSDVKKENSRGSKTGQFGDTTRQISFKATTEDGRSMICYVTEEAHMRLSEIPDYVLAKVKPSTLGISPADWENMDREERIEKCFDSFENEEGEAVAVALVTIPTPFNVKVTYKNSEGKSITVPFSFSVVKGNRVLDPDKSVKAKRKVMTILKHCGLPAGTVIKSDDQVLEQIDGAEIGIHVERGLKNAKGQWMPRFAWSMPADEVEELD